MAPVIITIHISSTVEIAPLWSTSSLANIDGDSNTQALIQLTPLPAGVETIPSHVSDSPDPELIELPADENTPLGLQIRSCNNQPGVFVHHLVPGSRADQCGLLQPGDRVLEANGQDLKFASVDDAASIISVSPKVIFKS